MAKHPVSFMKTFCLHLVGYFYIQQQFIAPAEIQTSTSATHTGFDCGADKDAQENEGYISLVWYI